ncbi:MAG: hypothetical protein ACON4H_08530 [Rubripirellula sp.]
MASHHSLDLRFRTWIFFVLGYYGRQLIKKQDDEAREERLRRHMRQVALLQNQAESRQARIEK